MDKDKRSNKWAVQRETNEVIRQTVVSNVHEQGRALLTHTALENLGALSSLEEQLANWLERCGTLPTYC